VRRPPLLATALVTASLVLVPAVALWRLPRPKAQGLEQLLPQTSLLQSFQAAPDRPVPRLWRDRLGAGASERLWRQQRGIWWQFWSRDGDAGPFLAFAAAERIQVGGALRLDDLVLLAPDPLSRRQLSDQLSSVGRQRRGLERRCLDRLRWGQAVYWSPVGLAELTGPLASLLQQASQGCLSLVPGGGRQLRLLDFQGESAATTGVLGEPAKGQAPTATLAPLPAGVLLELRGPSLAPLLNTLLARSLIRDPLGSRYGLGASQLKRLTSVPFRLRLGEVPRGPFQAGLDLQLAVGPDRRPWASMLADLRKALLDQNLQEAPPQLSASQPGVRSQTLPAAVFLREDGTVVGGWRWQVGDQGEPQLRLFLGPVAETASPAVPPQAKGSPLRLSLRPAALNALRLMPPALPELVRSAQQLEIELSPSDRPLSRLSGRLRLPAVR
jgi:hypothetical protein